jgi:hypothetical protein
MASRVRATALSRRPRSAATRARYMLAGHRLRGEPSVERVGQHGVSTLGRESGELASKIDIDGVFRDRLPRDHGCAGVVAKHLEGPRVNESLGVTSTPTVIINGWRYSSPPYDSLAALSERGHGDRGLLGAGVGAPMVADRAAGRQEQLRRESRVDERRISQSVMNLRSTDSRPAPNNRVRCALGEAHASNARRFIAAGESLAQGARILTETLRVLTCAKASITNPTVTTSVSAVSHLAAAVSQ